MDLYFEKRQIKMTMKMTWQKVTSNEEKTIKPVTKPNVGNISKKNALIWWDRKMSLRDTDRHELLDTKVYYSTQLEQIGRVTNQLEKNQVKWLSEPIEKSKNTC